MTLQELVSTMIALERREPVSLPTGWSSIRAELVRRLKDDVGFRAEYRACYLELTAHEQQTKPTSPHPRDEPTAEVQPEEEVPMPLVERVMASFQLDLPTAEIDRSALGAFDPDQTQMARLPDGPALPFREGPGRAPPSFPIGDSPDAGETMPLFAPDDLKAQVMAIRRVHEMTIEEYAALRAALVIAREVGGPDAEPAIWKEARLPVQADQDRLRQRFFDLFQRDPSQREAFETALRHHISKLRPDT